MTKERMGMNVRAHEITADITAKLRRQRRWSPIQASTGSVRRWATGVGRRVDLRRREILTEEPADAVWFWHLMRHEVERCRRHGSALTVVATRSNDPATMADRYRDDLRHTDAVAVDGSNLYVMLADTTLAESLGVTERLDVLQPHRDDWLRVEFPGDALTYTDFLMLVSGQRAPVRERLAG
jgi:hypothetical protein